MNVLMIGCGAIGSFYAERLASAGVDVAVTARGEHLKALKTALTVVHDGEKRVRKVSAYSHQELKECCHVDDFDVIVVALKATQTKQLMLDLGPWLQAGNTPILSLQNGVDNEPFMATVIGTDRVWGGLSVRSGGEISQPGTATTTGIFKIIMGPWPQAGQYPPALLQLAELWRSQGVPLDTSLNIQKELWKKLIVNNGVNPLSAVKQLETYALTHEPDLAELVFAAMQETGRAASYDGVELSADEVKEMFELIKSFNSIKTSMLIDLEKGRELEIDAIMGSVIVRCRLLGEPAVVTESLWAKLTDRVIPSTLDELFR